MCHSTSMVSMYQMLSNRPIVNIMSYTSVGPAGKSVYLEKQREILQHTIDFIVQISIYYYILHNEYNHFGMK